MDYNNLWRFVGEELYLIHHDKKLLRIPAEVVVRDLNEGEVNYYFYNIFTASTEEYNKKASESEKEELRREYEWETHEGEFDNLQNIKTMEKNFNAQILVQKFIKKNSFNSIEKLEKMFPEFKNKDFLILIRTKNMPKAQRQVSTPEKPISIAGVRLFFIIHEMVDTYSRFTRIKFGRGFIEAGEGDLVASKILERARFIFGLNY